MMKSMPQPMIQPIIKTIVQPMPQPMPQPMMKPTYQTLVGHEAMVQEAQVHEPQMPPMQQAQVHPPSVQQIQMPPSHQPMMQGHPMMGMDSIPILHERQHYQPTQYHHGQVLPAHSVLHGQIMRGNPMMGMDSIPVHTRVMHAIQHMDHEKSIAIQHLLGQVGPHTAPPPPPSPHTHQHYWI